MSSEAADLAALRLAVRRSVLPDLGGVEVEQALLRASERTIAAARAHGAHQTLHRAGRTVAGVTWFDDPNPWFGAPVTLVSVDVDPADASAVAWTRERLTVVLRSAGAGLHYAMEAAHVPALLPAVWASGCAVDSILLIGECERALDRLGPVDVQARLRAADVELREGAAGDVEAMVELNRAVFDEEPEFCWFGAATEYLSGLRVELATAVGSLEPPYVLVRRGELLGWFRASRVLDSLWGNCGGMGVVLHSELRGLGLLRVFYRVALGQLRDAGVRWFRGGTSQPPVMGLAQRIDRRLAAAHVRRVGGFEPRHFAEWLPG